MTALSTRVDRASKEFLQNSAAMEAQLTDLSDRLSQIRLGGGESARKRHTERGKLLPRARIEALQRDELSPEPRRAGASHRPH